jgi:hypothetical protein
MFGLFFHTIRLETMALPFAYSSGFMEFRARLAAQQEPCVSYYMETS